MRKISSDLEPTINGLDDRIINVGNFFYKNGSPDVYNNLSGSMNLISTKFSLFELGSSNLVENFKRIQNGFEVNKVCLINKDIKFNTLLDAAKTHNLKTNAIISYPNYKFVDDSKTNQMGTMLYGFKYNIVNNSTKTVVVKSQLKSDATKMHIVTTVYNEDGSIHTAAVTDDTQDYVKDDVGTVTTWNYNNSYKTFGVYLTYGLSKDKTSSGFYLTIRQNDYSYKGTDSKQKISIIDNLNIEPMFYKFDYSSSIFNLVFTTNDDGTYTTISCKFIDNDGNMLNTEISGSISTLLDSSISFDSIRSIADINNNQLISPFNIKTFCANSNNELLTNAEIKIQFNIKV